MRGKIKGTIKGKRMKNKCLYIQKMHTIPIFAEILVCSAALHSISPVKRHYLD